MNVALQTGWVLLKPICAKARGPNPIACIQNTCLCSEIRWKCGGAIALVSVGATKMNAAAEPVEFTDRAEEFSAEQRERLILEHLPQVRLIARRIHSRLPDNVSLDDLISTGVLGLIAAIDRFEPSRHVHLRTYAEHKIKGSILDSLRRMDWAPRQERKRAKEVEAAIAEVEQRVQRAPTEDEIASELHLTVDRYHQWQVRIRGLNPGRLESAGSADSESRDLLRVISDDASEWPSALFERKELQRTLAAAISELPDVEKTVLNLYHLDELTLREIARIVGVHESRISQLRSQAIRRLRVSMATLWPAIGNHSILTGRPAPSKPPAPAFRMRETTSRGSVQAG
jgi:RNA polymerase sigma factor for flagellar operon FliA